jgi:hypothetical protein
MQAKSPSAAERRGQPVGPCQCGCAPCDRQCCELECLVRPRFFCGQLLTDADLTALVEWSRAHFRLARHRHGWGVVCGLEVTRDPSTPAGVLVGPGYGIDCCGNEVLLCEPLAYSLAAACPKTECFDPRAERRKRREELAARADRLLGQVAEIPKPGKALADATERLRRAMVGDDPDAIREAARGVETAAERVRPGFGAEQVAASDNLFAAQLGGARAVDLFLHYAEAGAEPQSGLRQNGCGPAPCEDSRTREGARLSWQIVDSAASPDPALDEWVEGYRSQRAAVEELALRLSASRDPATLRQHLAAYIRERERGQLCFIYDWISEATNDELSEANLTQAILWLYLDGLMAWLARGCPSCSTATGIPLARIWLRGQSDGKPCRVVVIDSHPPRRRPLRPDDNLPAPAGLANLADLIGWRWADAEAALLARGFQAVEKTLRLEGMSLEAMRPLLDAAPFVAYDKRVATALSIDLGSGWGRRVVGFQQG